MANTTLQSEVELTAKQKLLLLAIIKYGYRFILFGGAIRGAKSFGILICAAVLARIFPGSRWAVVRKSLPDLKATIIPTYEKVRALFPDFLGPVVYTVPVQAKCSNGSVIIFWPESYDQDKDLDRFKGLEVNGFLPDEANELQQKTFDKMMERAGTHIIPGLKVQPPGLIIGTCNPNKLWPKTIFYDPWKKGELKHPYGYIPAGPQDNQFLPKEFLANLLALKDRNPIHYAKYVLGDWDVSEGDIFRPDMFRFHDGSHDPREDVLGFFADLAYTKKKTSDYCAFGLAGVDKLGCKRWYETKIERMATDESTAYLLRKAQELSQRGLDVVFYIEANDAYIELLTQQARIGGIKMAIQQVKPAGTAKADRILATRMGLNLWEFDRNSQHLINQFLDWSPELEGIVPDDGPDMHAYADMALKWQPNQKSRLELRPKEYAGGQFMPGVPRDLYDKKQGKVQQVKRPRRAF